MPNLEPPVDRSLVRGQVSVPDPIGPLGRAAIAVILGVGDLSGVSGREPGSGHHAPNTGDIPVPYNVAQNTLRQIGASLSKRQFIQVVDRNYVTAIKAGIAPLGSEIARVLRGVPALILTSVNQVVGIRIRKAATKTVARPHLKAYLQLTAQFFGPGTGIDIEFR